MSITIYVLRKVNPFEYVHTSLFFQNYFHQLLSKKSAFRKTIKKTLANQDEVMLVEHFETHI